MIKPKEYTPKEVAELLGHSVSWIYKNAGVTIPVIRRGRRLRWTDELIEQIIRNGIVQPSAPEQRAVLDPPMQQAKRSKRKTDRHTDVSIPQARPERARRLREMGVSWP